MQRSKDIKITEYEVEDKDIYVDVPRYEEEEVEDSVVIQQAVEKTRSVKRSLMSRAIIGAGEIGAQVALSPVTLASAAYEGVTGNSTGSNPRDLHNSFDNLSQKDDKYIGIEDREILIRRKAMQYKGEEKRLASKVQVISNQVEKIVGKTFLRGGYSVIELILGVGLGIEEYYSDLDNSKREFDVSECLETGKKIVREKASEKLSQIEGLVDSEEKRAEERLINLLREIFV